MQKSGWVVGGVLAWVLACGGLGSQAEAPAEGASSDADAGEPAVVSGAPHAGRAGHVGVPLADGRVLFTAGNGSPGEAEVYVHEREGWAAVGAPVQPRFGHAMVRLKDGRVLLVGGEDPDHADPLADPTGLSAAEVFDPSSDTFTAVASSSAPFLRPKVALLPDGRVLVVNCEVGEVRAERYDPTADSWSEAAAPTRCGEDDDLVAIAGGVLVGSGGVAYELERYDAATDTWSRTAPAPRKRTNRLVVLPDGRVLATGRRSEGADEPDAAVLDPDSDRWTPTGSIPRSFDAVEHPSFALVAVGNRVWRLGGSAGRPPEVTAGVEIWDAATGAWTAAGPLEQARYGASASALPDGSVLVYGGRGVSGGPPLDSAEVLRR